MLGLLLIILPTAKGQINSVKITPDAGDSASSVVLGIVQDPTDNSYLYMGTTALGTEEPELGARVNRTAHFMKLDVNGDVLWSKGITDSAWEIGVASAVATNNGFIVSAYLDSVRESKDVFEIDPSGNILWSKHYPYSSPGTLWYLEKIMQVQGAYLNMGVTNSAQVLCNKLDATGNIIWQKRYDLRSEFSSVQSEVTHAMELQDGSYLLLVGFVTTVFNPPFEREIVILNINTDGSLAWAKTVGYGDVNRAHYAHQDANGNIIVVGEFYEDDETYDAAIYRFDPVGNLNLARGYSSGSEVGKWIGPSGNDWYMYTEANHLIHLDGDFEVIGAKSLNRANMLAHSCFQASDGSVVCGQRIKGGSIWDPYCEYGLTRTELNMELSCVDSAITIEAYSLQHPVPTLSVGVYDTQFGQENTNLVFEDIPFESLDLCYGVGIEERSEMSRNPSWSVYPNPTDNEITVDLQPTFEGRRISVVNGLGQTVLQSVLSDSKTKINLGGYKPGVYGIRVESDNRVETKKVVLIREQ